MAARIPISPNTRNGVLKPKSAAILVIRTGAIIPATPTPERKMLVPRARSFGPSQYPISLFPTGKAADSPRPIRNRTIANAQAAPTKFRIGNLGAIVVRAVNAENQRIAPARTRRAPKRSASQPTQ